MNTFQQVWIVGRGNYRLIWNFHGVFDSKEKAEAACVGPDYFVGPANMNFKVSEELTVWFGAYYPRSVK